jgi:hypothetical protein
LCSSVSFSWGQESSASTENKAFCSEIRYASVGKPIKKDENKEEEVFQPPKITRDPQSRSITINSRCDLRVTALGTPKPTYQWLHNGTKLAGANGPMLVIPRFQRNNAGQYICEVKNKAGTVQSRMATISIKAKDDAEDFKLNSDPLTPKTGEPLRIFLTPETQESVDWYFNDEPLKGVKGSEYNIKEFKETYQGKYHATIIVGGKYLTTPPLNLKIATGIVMPPPLPVPPPLPNVGQEPLSLLDQLDSKEEVVVHEPTSVIEAIIDTGEVEAAGEAEMEEFIPDEPSPAALEEEDGNDDAFFTFEAEPTEDEPISEKPVETEPAKIEPEIIAVKETPTNVLKLQKLMKNISEYKPNVVNPQNPQSQDITPNGDWIKFVHELKNRLSA